MLLFFCHKIRPSSLCRQRTVHGSEQMTTRSPSRTGLLLLAPGIGVFQTTLLLVDHSTGGWALG